MSTPDQTFHLDGLNVSDHLLQIGLIIPWLDIQSDNRLGSWLSWLVSLSSLVFSDSLSLNLFSFLIFFIIGTEKIDFIVIFFFSSSGSWSRSSWERSEFFASSSNVIEPSGKVWVGLLESLVDSNVSLRGRSTNSNLLVKKKIHRTGISKLSALLLLLLSETVKLITSLLSLIPGVLLPVINTDQRIKFIIIKE